MEYRANFMFRLGVNSIVPLVIKIYLFQALFWATQQASGQSVIGGYHEDDMMLYQLWGALVLLLVEIRTTVENVQLDIRLGRITRYLLYPISMFEIVNCQYLAALVLQGLVFIVGLGVMSWWVDDFPIYWQDAVFWQALLLVLMGSIFWHLIHFTIGLAAFWLEEIWTFFIIFQMVARFLGGNPVPIEMFGDWWRPISECLPFHWMFYAPVKMLSTGQPLANATFGVAALGFWIIAITLLHRLVWKSGIKQYSAAGM